MREWWSGGGLVGWRGEFHAAPVGQSDVSASARQGCYATTPQQIAPPCSHSTTRHVDARQRSAGTRSVPPYPLFFALVRMSVRVVARVRPLLRHELDKDAIVTAESAADAEPHARPTIVRLPNPKNGAESFSFQFSSVFEQHASQQELFDAEISPTVKHLFNGFDLSIFAHGCTGTGKTHTMRGGKALADRGVIPRLLSAIFRRCKRTDKESGGTTRVDVALEYFEIYCERVYDLFEPPEKRTPSGLPIRDHGGKTVVVGLTEKPCATLKEFEQLYDQANINRSTSATKVTPIGPKHSPPC